LFYAEQVINNACATQAILSVLMNTSSVDIGTDLGNLKDFVGGMSAKDKGYAIGNSESIRIAHNSFARQEPFEMEERPASKDDEMFHFIAYVPFNGKLYELDGCQGGPILLGEVDEETWLPVAREEINKRISQYESKEVRFNLLAVTGDLLNKYEDETKTLKLKGKHLADILGSEFEGVEGQLTEDQKSSLPTDKEGQEKALNDIQSQVFELEDKKKEEIEKREKWSKENQRRKHNYVPLVLEFLKLMSEKNMITDLYKTAEEKHQKKEQEEQSKKEQEAN
jgi:ubiquitin carboxyl-terminal hydrolase L5